MIRLDADNGPLGGVDPDWSLGFLVRRAIPGMERGDRTVYQRLLGATAGWAVGTATLVGDRLEGHLEPRTPPRLERAWLRNLFDLDRDLTPFQRLAGRDRILAPLVGRRPGIRVPRLLDPFEATVRAIVGQLISVPAARTVLGRLVAQFGEPNPARDHPLSRAFPIPAALERVPALRIRRCGVTQAKAEAIRALARATVLGELDWAASAALPPEEADQALQSWRGIGAWTAAYVRIRAFGDPDVSLATDLGIRHALAALGVNQAAMAATIDRWRPWRSYAMMHLWASLDSASQ